MIAGKRVSAHDLRPGVHDLCTGRGRSADPTVDRAMKKLARQATCAVLLMVIGACATLNNLLQPPRFSAAAGRGAELRLLRPSADRPLGGAAVRVYARVENPNSFGVRIASLDGDLFLENTRAAIVDLPLGLPLLANQDTVVPIDIAVGFNELPGLADLAARALTRATLPYRLDARFTVDAGVLGTPTFGPETLLRGELAVRR